MPAGQAEREELVKVLLGEREREGEERLIRNYGITWAKDDGQVG